MVGLVGITFVMFLLFHSHFATSITPNIISIPSDKFLTYGGNIGGGKGVSRGYEAKGGGELHLGYLVLTGAG